MGLLDLLKGFTKKSTAEIKAQTPGEMRRANSLELAAKIYADNPPWLYEGGEVRKGAGLGAFLASEAARLITLECKIECEDKAVDGIIKRCVMPLLRKEVEKGWALGGLAMKPYYRGAALQLDSGDRVIGVSGNLKVAFLYPGQFAITAQDGGRITGIQFFDTIRQDRAFYTLIEEQAFDEASNALTITNKVYKTDADPGVYTRASLSGTPVSLDTVERWAGLLPRIVFNDVRGILCGLYFPAISNNKDVNTIYGISPLTRAAAAIERADKTIAALDWELDASMARLYADELVLGDGVNGRMAKLPKHIARITPGDNRNLFEIFSPDIRDHSYLNILNAHLRLIEDAVGMAHGTISRGDERLMTATEVVITRQRTYAMVTDNQKALENAIRDLAYSTGVWLNPFVVGDGYEMSFDFDDSVVSNPAEQIKTEMSLFEAGVIPSYKLV